MNLIHGSAVLIDFGFLKSNLALASGFGITLLVSFREEKSAALDGCVNTFIILHTMEGTFKIQKDLQISKF
jgi:hypothetical protein